MFSRNLSFLLAAALLAGCASHQTGNPRGQSPFTALSEEFTRGYLSWRPHAGTALGFHQYDGRVGDYSGGSVQGEITRLHKFDRALADLPEASLPPEEQYDRSILRTAIAAELFNLEEMRAYRVNPMSYLNALDLTIYIKRDFAPLDNRVESIIKIERQIPNLFSAARANLEASIPKPYVETAIEMGDGLVDFFSKDLAGTLAAMTNRALHARFEAANTNAIQEIRRFTGYLKTEKLGKAHLHYAVGQEKYRKMLASELIEMAPEKILELGLAELKREQRAFADAARIIDPNKAPAEVFKAIQKDHPTAEGLLGDVKKNLEAIRRFVVERKLVSVASQERARVEETPQFARATSFASMDTPGAFEAKAREAFYYVTPTEKEWPEKQKEEWLTAFNYYTTDIVSIHEAYPGHYTQFLALNASSASRVEKIFTSYAFVEGWAHYCERMMLDEGFAAEDKIKAAKYRLAQSDEALLRLCRLCVSIKTHCLNMTLEDATKFFEENCYYEHKPAYQEALRGTFDPQYLYYTMGKLQILKLREDYHRQEGARFSLSAFHDELLRHGAPPLQLLRQRLLKDPKLWPEAL